MTNVNIFLYKDEEETVVCDSYNQRYFSLTDDYVKYLLKNHTVNPNDEKLCGIGEDLKSAGLLENSNQAEKTYWKGDPISYFTHMGTRIHKENTHILNTTEFIDQFTTLSCAVTIPQNELLEYSDEIHLPTPNLEKLKNISLFDSFKSRKTSRQFLRENVSMDDLSSILYCCFSYIHGQEWADFSENNIKFFGKRRSFPSAAAMEGTTVYLMIRSFSGLTPGVFFYEPKQHKLLKVNEEPSDSLITSLMADQFWSKDISIGFFLVANMHKTWTKDIKARGYLATYLEAGHASQNLQLSATAMGLNTWITGTFRDDEMSELLALKTIEKFATFFVGVGKGLNHSIPQEFLD